MGPKQTDRAHYNAREQCAVLSEHTQEREWTISDGCTLQSNALDFGKDGYLKAASKLIYMEKQNKTKL